MGQHPHTAMEYYDRGNANMVNGKFQEAINDFAAAINLRPKFAAAYNSLGTLCHHLGMHAKAVVYLTQAVSFEPRNPLFISNRALIYRNQKDYDAAIAEFDFLLTLPPHAPAAWLDRAAAYLYKGDLDQAIAGQTRAIELDPKSSRAYNDRGVAYYRKGDYPSALADLTVAIGLEPDDPDVQEALAATRKALA
jgi:tetratricopeptide (TPR) repeat protein